MKNMRNSLIYFFLLLPLTGLHAQISIGINAGPSFSTISSDFGENQVDDDIIQSGYTSGFFVSVPIEFTLNGPLALQTEVNFHQKGTRLHFEDFEDQLNSYKFESNTLFNYVQIPLLMKLKMGKGAFRTSVYAGPSVSFLASGSTTSLIDAKIMGEDFTNETKETLELEDGINRWEFSALVGVGLELDAGPGAITLDLRYQQGFSTLTNDVELNVYNRGFTSALGYKIMF